MGPLSPLWKYKETSHGARRRSREMRESSKSSMKPGEVDDADRGSVGFKCFHVVFADITQSSANENRSHLSTRVEDRLVRWLKRNSHFTRRALTCLKASQVSAPRPPRFMCAIHESADVTIVMIIMMAVFIYLQR